MARPLSGRRSGDGGWRDRLAPEDLLEPHEIATGVGRVLFAEALKAPRAAGATELVVAADPGAAGFFARMGARPAGEAPSGCIPGLILPRFAMRL